MESLFFSAPPLPSSPLPLLMQCHGCLDDYTWPGLITELQRLPAMGVCHSLGAGWS